MALVNPEEAEYVRNLFRAVGYSHIGKPDQSAFEKHFMENTKVFTFHGSLCFEVAQIEYYDSASGDVDLGGIIAGGRRFRFMERFLEIPRSLSLDKRLVEALIQDDFLVNGLPIGMITDDRERKKQIQRLGARSEGQFSALVNFNNTGEIRVYMARHFPAYYGQSGIESLKRRN